MSSARPELQLQRWVETLRSAYPTSTTHLSLEQEKELLAELEPFFSNCRSIKRVLEGASPSDLPGGLQASVAREAAMLCTDDETRAWSNLLATLSAHLGTIAMTYYRVHQNMGGSIPFEDVLAYLPEVFLTVLSAYNPTRAQTHEVNFSHEAGRVRLITWVQIDARRHINSFLRQNAYLVKRGSAQVHRQRERALSASARAEQLDKTQSPEVSTSLPVVPVSARLGSATLTLPTASASTPKPEPAYRSELLEENYSFDGTDGLTSEESPPEIDFPALIIRGTYGETREALVTLLYTQRALTHEEITSLKAWPASTRFHASASSI